ncbi:MAG: helix-turn-helix transcriptional regulator [Alphaproteobacteria bacterium]|nr:helix-turn-helix transcriptional regulator [Alphaproteobacteria bacterium]
MDVALKLDQRTFARKSHEAASLLKALANERRLQIVCLLVDGERSVGDIVNAIGLSQSAISQHLARLRRQKLVATRRDSTTIYYRLHDPKAARVIETLASIYCPPHLTMTRAAPRRAR